MATTGQHSLSTLLQKWKFLTPADLAHARERTVEVGLPLGLVLVMDGVMEPHILQAVIACQSMLRDGITGMEEATKAVEVVRKKNVTLTVAFDLLGVELKQKSRTRLGDLLLESDSISRETLKRALQIGKTTCLPLGRVLLSLGELPQDLVGRALSLQALVRSGKETRDGAIAQLRTARECLRVLTDEDQSKVEESTRVGALLRMAGLCTDEDIKAALAEAKEGNGRIGDVMVNRNLISPELRDAAIEMQRLVRVKRFGLHHSIEVLRRISGSAEGICHLTFPDQSDEQRSNVDLLHFLRLLRALPGSRGESDSPKNVSKKGPDDTWESLRSITSQINATSGQVPEELSELMQRAGYLTDEQQQSFLRAGSIYALFRAGEMSAEQALIQFHGTEVHV